MSETSCTAATSGTASRTSARAATYDRKERIIGVPPVRVDSFDCGSRLSPTQSGEHSKAVGAETCT